jgi:hypothetical protein
MRGNSLRVRPIGVHRTARTAIGEAHRRGYVSRNSQLLREHREQQDRDRAHARQRWRESGYAGQRPEVGAHPHLQSKTAKV